MVPRPWQSEFKRIGAHFPELHDATPRDIQKLKATLKGHDGPDRAKNRQDRNASQQTTTRVNGYQCALSNGMAGSIG